MTDSDPSQDQTPEIGDRYLLRAIGEIVRLRELIANARDGGPTSLDKIHRLAHRMQGSGAMFGSTRLVGRLAHSNVWSKCA